MDKRIRIQTPQLNFAIAMSEPLEELKVKLEQQKLQLNQVEHLLAADPSNEQLIKLQNDLSQLIEMTDSLCGNSIEKDNLQNHQDDAVVEVIGSRDVAVPSSAADMGLTNSSAAIAVPVAPVAAASGAVAAGVGPIAEGDVVLVSGGERPYAAYVTSVVSNAALEDGNGVRVTYYEYENTEVDLPLSAISRLPSGPINSSNRECLSSGNWSGQCKYAPDQLYYDAIITEVTPYGARVTYTQFGNSEHVPLAYLRPNKEKTTRTPGINSNGLMEIPAKYQIKDTDTEEERRWKLKKQKSIKAKNKEITKETEVAAVQKSWQKFVAKGNKRNLAGLNKSSMFAGRHDATEDNGVVTQNAKRKKHKY